MKREEYKERDDQKPEKDRWESPMFDGPTPVLSIMRSGTLSRKNKTSPPKAPGSKGRVPSFLLLRPLRMPAFLLQIWGLASLLMGGLPRDPGGPLPARRGRVFYFLKASSDTSSSSLRHPTASSFAREPNASSSPLSLGPPSHTSWGFFLP
ncbi:unnamed protein product [Boreogadus saida]